MEIILHFSTTNDRFFKEDMQTIKICICKPVETGEGVLQPNSINLVRTETNSEKVEH